MTRSRSLRAACRGSLALGLLALATTLLVAAPSTATTTPPAVQAQAAGSDDLPVHAQTQVLGVLDEGTPLVLSVHGVQRVDGAALVYYSAAWPQDSTHSNFDLYGALGPAAHYYLQRPHVGHSECDVAVIDQVGAQMYLPLPPREAMCTPKPLGEPGEARVAAVTVAELEPEVTVVDVSIHGTVLTDVPVGDGELAPLHEDSGAPLLGMGWPLPELGDIPDSTADYVIPLRQMVSDLEGEISETATAIEVAGDVLFEVDSWDIDGDGQAILAQAVEQLRQHEDVRRLLVVGHTDSDGTAERNQTLSENRAESVGAALRQLLGSEFTIETEGRGQDDPIASNTTSEGKALNRRVSIEFGRDS